MPPGQVSMSFDESHDGLLGVEPHESQSKISCFSRLGSQLKPPISRMWCVWGRVEIPDFGAPVNSGRGQQGGAMFGRRLGWSTVVHAGVVSGVLSMAAPAIAADASRQMTFSKDVAPILQAKCQECHQPNSIAPMSLITYQDARPWPSVTAPRDPSISAGLAASTITPGRTAPVESVT